jgi:mono/diheme cytochrome c family protein
MLRFWNCLTLAVLLGTALGCNSGPHSSAGFRLPPNGDIDRGKAAFVALQCNTCHEVARTPLPPPTVQPAVPVVLGGDITWEKTDGYLVASIINPSHKLAGRRKDLTTIAGGKSRMPEYADIITVRQLTDIVAFLQSRYTIRQLPRDYSQL